jgi:DNA invertase Pin-like site-specific DNA recombinase
MVRKYEVPDIPVPPHPCKGSCACEPTVAYLRVSAIMGREDIVSWDIQLHHIVKEARKRRRRIVAVEYDVGSGRSFTRRKVAQIVDAIKAGTYRHVSLWKWSRWGRNLEESLTWLTKVKEAGGRVDSATEDHDQERASGRFSRDVLMRVDQLLSEQIGETWKDVHALRRDAGLPHTGRTRMGYEVVDGDYVTTERVMHEAELMADAYQRYVDGGPGNSLRTLTLEWIEQGIPTRMGAREWTPQALGRVLDTGFAAGLIRECSDPAARKSNNLAAFDVWREGSHDPIISRELWDAYKAKRLAASTAPPTERPTTLSAVLRCWMALDDGTPCGRRLYSKHSGRDRQHQWVCVAAKFRHPGGVSLSVANSIAVGAVRGWVEERARRFVSPAAVDAEAKRLATEERRVERTAERIRRDLAAAHRKLERARELYVEGEYTKATFQEKKAKVEQEIANLQVALAEAEGARRAPAPEMVAAFTDLADNWDTYLRLPAELNALLRTVLDRVEVAPPVPGARRTESAGRLRFVPRWAS